MKNFLFFFLLIPILAFSQVPQGVGYQGVATDAAGFELINQSISIRASVISGSATGTIEWQETHTTSTDTFGLFNLTIGQGTSTGNGAQANFADISWGSATHFLKIEMDVNGGTNYSHMGTNQMMSVPYALYAENANINYDSISSLLSNDSTFITNVSGGVVGGCDLNYPDGLSGEIVYVSISLANNITYTVPSGKRLYISRLIGNGLSIDSIEFFTGVGNYGTPRPLISTIVVDENQVLSLPPASSNIRFIGMLVDASVFVEPISHSLLTNYTVPSSKILIITYINRGTGSIQLNGNEISKLSEITFTAFPINGGGILDGSGSFNGYLVDDNYFSDCFGGGVSSVSTDSSYIDSLVQFYSNGSSGGCNIKFPEGVNGEGITLNINSGQSYTVPSNKRFYITAKYGNNIMNINGHNIQANPGEHTSPLVANSGDVIAPAYNAININGILVQENLDLQALTLNINSGQSYTVPSNKRFYITAKYGNNIMNINGHNIQANPGEHISPLVANSGDVIAPTYNAININGYLVDENYFADCLGSSGSSSSVTSPNIFYYPNSSYYVIPNGISIVEITLVGAVGGIGGSNLLCNSNSGYSSPGGLGGIGGMINFLLPCNAGDSLFFNVGINGTNGTNASSECINGTSGAVGGSTTVSLNGVLVATANGGDGGGPGSCLCGYYGNSPGTVGSDGSYSISLSSAIEMDSGFNDGAKAILKF